MGAEFFESHSTLERADFTVGTPASSSVTAALRLGDRVPVARADLTHVLEYLGEAVPFPVVWKGRYSEKRILGYFMSIARYQKFGQIRNPKGCNTLPWVRRSEKEKLETAVREKRCHLREQIRNSVSRQKGIGSDKVTTLSVPRNMWEWSC